MKKLCVGIPTFNRSSRLQKTLRELCSEIVFYKKNDSISVYVSDNGSSDNTSNVLMENQSIFEMNGISFAFDLWHENKGFDKNVIRCYEKCDAEYLWLFSDDDNIKQGALNTILSDINTIMPNVIYYNFDQYPYGENNRLVREKALYFTFETSESISKIVSFPKLSSIVIRKNDGVSGSKISKIEGIEGCGFMHVMLAIQSIFDHGKLLLSNDFIAYPDEDYMNHINFPPYIFNELNFSLYKLYKLNNRNELFHSLNLSDVNPLNSSLNWLGNFYLGKMILTPSLKKTLISTVLCELRKLTFLKRHQLRFGKAIIMFLAGYIYHYGRIVFQGKNCANLLSKK
jgi:glycosyltransferase involved in cell wall biosynthesis